MMKEYQQLSNVYPSFQPMLKRVIDTTCFGVSCGRIELIKVTSSYDYENKLHCGDRFHISIPYAKQSLYWTVMFDALNPEMGPDFEFDDKTFLVDPNIKILEEYIPSLLSWDYTNDDCLLNVLNELVLCYKKYQREKLSDRLDLEYSTILEQTEICEEDVEIILLRDPLEPTEAHFLIRIATDFSKLPTKTSCADQLAVMLHVIFQGANWSHVVPQIYFSSSLNDALGDLNHLHIPPLSVHITLMDYVPEIKKMIDDKVNAVVTNYKKKNEYIASMLLLQGVSLIEYDATNFSNIFIILSHRDFYILVEFSLSLTFPSDPPKITLHSIYNLDNTRADVYKTVLKEIPYNSCWHTNKMVTVALTHIAEKTDAFRKSSMRHRNI